MTEHQNIYTIGAHLYNAPIVPAGLYIISTPIGNLGDITLRALESLAAVDILLCEDTRVSRVLLHRFGIKRALFSYHEHNAVERIPELIEALLAGKSVGLISDAGTPMISDPGYKLVSEALKRGIKIIPIPGACAAITALVSTGFATDQFLFVGFLPAKQGLRRKKLEALSSISSTLIFYETPQRVKASLQDMADIFGAQRRIGFCRELTKIYETIKVDSLSGLSRSLQEEQIRGEIVLVLEGAEKTLEYTETMIDKMLLDFAKELPSSKAAAEVAKITNQRKQDLYQRLLALKDA